MYNLCKISKNFNFFENFHFFQKCKNWAKSRGHFAKNTEKPPPPGGAPWQDPPIWTSLVLYGADQVSTRVPIRLLLRGGPPDPGPILGGPGRARAKKIVGSALARKKNFFLFARVAALKVIILCYNFV